jgi:hypothetical protein
MPSIVQCQGAAVRVDSDFQLLFLSLSLSHSEILFHPAVLPVFAQKSLMKSAVYFVNIAPLKKRKRSETKKRETPRR